MHPSVPRLLAPTSSNCFGGSDPSTPTPLSLAPPRLMLGCRGSFTHLLMLINLQWGQGCKVSSNTGSLVDGGFVAPSVGKRQPLLRGQLGIVGHIGCPATSMSSLLSPFVPHSWRGEELRGMIQGLPLGKAWIFTPPRQTGRWPPSLTPYLKAVYLDQEPPRTLPLIESI